MVEVAAWGGRRANAARAQVRAVGYVKDERCCICRQPIDYRLPSTHPDGMSVQHVKPRSTHPHLTWDPANWKPAHLRCNQGQGTKTIDELGMTSRDWSML